MPLYEITQEGLSRRDAAPRDAGALRACGSSVAAQQHRRLWRRVIAEELRQWEEARRGIDLLALGLPGRLVVIELKRTEDGGHMDLQSLRYPRWCRT